MPDELLAKPMPAHFQDFIFTRELAEVYLLLDNVSTSSEKSLPPSPGLAAQGQPAEPDLIEEICRIVWPPTVVWCCVTDASSLGMGMSFDGSSLVSVTARRS